MASISRLCCVHMGNLTASKDDKGPSPPITLNHHKTIPSSITQEGRAPYRRQLILHAPLALAAFAIPNAFALNDVSEDVRTYTDDENKFKIDIPQEWQVGTGESNGFKSITAFYPTEASNSNVSVVITGLGPDFTRMESFGKVDEFAQTLVSGLDRSWQRPPGVAAKLIDCKSSNGIYYMEYSLQNPGESRRHLYSAIGMASNGWYNRLYTVTGQFVEEETDKYASQVQKRRSLKWLLSYVLKFSFHLVSAASIKRSAATSNRVVGFHTELSMQLEQQLEQPLTLPKQTGKQPARI
ncbi:PsbP domain-containing protein 3, chloroplastic [Mucuna pruriens]|uniref:PsbP domain-containing protein 3, chloroplastic n=1 Tax=Mucuna pruriens TaxID=157652 RepID=A0A371EG82_MUCPR|nr:PsbP domain-containing protein 3, chloroplastic [Mucuna pruriens]